MYLTFLTDVLEYNRKRKVYFLIKHHLTIIKVVNIHVHTCFICINMD